MINEKIIVKRKVATLEILKGILYLGVLCYLIFWFIPKMNILALHWQILVWIMTIIFGLASFSVLLPLIPGYSHLELSKDGFKAKSFFSGKFIKWSKIKDIQVDPNDVWIQIHLKDEERILMLDTYGADQNELLRQMKDLMEGNKS